MSRKIALKENYKSVQKNKEKSNEEGDDDDDEFSDIDIRGPYLETHGPSHPSSSSTTGGEQDSTHQPYVYAKRWIILAVLSITIFVNACCLNLNGDFQSNIHMFYRRLLPDHGGGWLAESLFFGLHIAVVEVLSTVAAVIVLELRGLRATCLVGITLACLGAWIRCATLLNKMYSILFAGLVLCDVGQVYMNNAVFYLSSKWFPHHQTAVAISIGLASNTLGILTAILFRLFFENNHEYRNFNHSYYGLLFVSVVATLVLGLAIIFIRDDPIRPPSLAQAQARCEEKKSASEQDWWEKFCQLARTCLKVLANLSFIELAIAFAFLVASTNVIVLILNSILVEYQKANQYAFEVAFVSSHLAAIVALVVSGIVLDFTKCFKLMLFLLYALALVSATGYSFTLTFNNWISVVFLALFCLFAYGFQPVAYEYAIELTHPYSVPVTCGLLNIFTLILTAIFRSFAKASISKHNSLHAHVFMLLFMVKGLVVTVFILKDYKRYEINKPSEI